MTTTMNTQATTHLDALRRERNRLADQLVHDCNNAEHCMCFGPEDVADFEAADRAFRVEVEEQIDARRAAARAHDLRARAAELDTPALPFAERIYTFEAALHLVKCHSAMADEMQERIARRMHTHGKCHWHSSWVVVGNDARGCFCAQCRPGTTH